MVLFRVLLFFALPLLLVGGCGKSVYYMPPHLQGQDENSLSVLFVHTTANPRAPIRKNQLVPYRIDGQEIPYEWVGSGIHRIILSPGEHTVECLRRPLWAILDHPSSELAAAGLKIFVYNYGGPGTQSAIAHRRWLRINGHFTVDVGEHSWPEIDKTLIVDSASDLAGLAIMSYAQYMREKE